MGGTVLGPGDEADLIDLAFHWNEAYDIAVLDGIWTPWLFAPLLPF